MSVHNMKKMRIPKSILLSLSPGDLIDLAKQQDLFVTNKVSRKALINELLELEIDVGDLPYKTMKMLGLQEYGELAYSYGQTEIHLLLSDPVWCFAFWDISEMEMGEIENELGSVRLFLRVMSFFSEKDTTPYTYQDIGIKEWERSLYINATSQSEFTQVSLMYRAKAEPKSEGQVLATSNFVYFPRKSLSARLSQEKSEADDVLNLSGLQYLRMWHYKKFNVLFDDEHFSLCDNETTIK